MAARTTASGGMFLPPAARLLCVSLHAGPHVPPPTGVDAYFAGGQSARASLCVRVSLRSRPCVTGVPVVDGRSRRRQKEI